MKTKELKNAIVFDGNLETGIRIILNEIDPSRFLYEKYLNKKIRLNQFPYSIEILIESIQDRTLIIRSQTREKIYLQIAYCEEGNKFLEIVRENFKDCFGSAVQRIIFGPKINNLEVFLEFIKDVNSIYQKKVLHITASNCIRSLRNKYPIDDHCLIVHPKINLFLPIKIRQTVGKDGYVITDAKDSEFFFYEKTIKSEEMEYDGCCISIKK